MNRQSQARAIANGRRNRVNTSIGKVVAEVICPTADDAREVLAAFGRAGWSTSFQGIENKTVRAEVKP
jgi:hypothetical protein